MGESVVPLQRQACCLEHLEDVVVECELYQQEPPGGDVVQVFLLRGLRNKRATTESVGKESYEEDTTTTCT